MPREAILLSGLAQVGLGFLVRLVILLMVLVWSRIVPPVTAVLFPLGILGLMLFGYLLGILLTPLGMLYHRDVMQALPLATTFLMLLTPVLYPVPEAGIAAGIATFNPLTPLVAAPRDWLTIGATPHAAAFIAITLVTIALLLLGWIIFRVAMPHLIARIGN